MVVETPFDNPIGNDIVLEETDNSEEFKKLLQNSENIIKAFLYLKKIFEYSSPFINRVIKMNTIDTSKEKAVYEVAPNTGKILIKNIDSNSSHSIFFNGGEFVLFPYESVEFPIVETDTIETQGLFSIIETEYKIGKDE